MKIEVKNSLNPIDYVKSIEILEQRVKDVFLGKKNELLWIIEHNPVYTAGTSSKSTDILDMSFTKNLSNYIISLNISNMLNEDYEKPATYNQDGRKIKLTSEEHSS